MGCKSSKVIPYPLNDTTNDKSKPGILAAKRVEIEEEKKEEQQPKSPSRYGYGTRNMSIFYTTTRGLPVKPNKFMKLKFLYRVPKKPARSRKININPFDDEAEYTYSLKSTKVPVDDPSALRILRKLA